MPGLRERAGHLARCRGCRRRRRARRRRRTSTVQPAAREHVARPWVVRRGRGTASCVPRSSSSTAPLATHLPCATIATRSHACSTSDEDVARHEHGPALARRATRISVRTSRMPGGSSPFAGSSRMSSSGSFSSAAAMPSRCFMPSEYVAKRVSAARSSPTWSSTAVDLAPGRCRGSGRAARDCDGR